MKMSIYSSQVAPRKENTCVIKLTHTHTYTQYPVELLHPAALNKVHIQFSSRF